MLDELNTPNKVVGIKQSVKFIDSNKALKVFIAKDADSEIIKPIQSACKKKDIEIEYVASMSELGKACDINVGAAVAVLISA